MSWGELQDARRPAANVLRAHGVERGDRVAVLLPPASPETAAMFLGTWKAGAILLSMSVLYGDEGIRHRITDSQPKVHRHRRGQRRSRSPGDLVDEVIVLDDELLAERRRPTSRPSTPRPTTRRSSTTRRAPPAWRRASSTPTATSSPTRSSSTATTCATASSSTAWASGRGRPGIAPLLGPWRSARRSSSIQREGGFDPAQQLEVLSKHGVTNVFTTPTAMRAMMAIEDAGERYPQKFRVVCSAGEPLNPEAIRWFREQYGVTVLDYYGLTRVLSAVRELPLHGGARGLDGQADAGLGRADPRRGRAAGRRTGERGEICLRARSNPHYPLGYWNNPEDSEETFGGEWFHTKDAAEQDEDGYFWYAGRADDVIISAGYRIGPFEVESACIEHPAVREAAAVASPDERRGHVVKAFVVLAEGHEPSDELADEIKRFVRDHLSAYAYPRRIEFVDELPKTLTGKIRRIELREREQQKQLDRLRPPRGDGRRQRHARLVLRRRPVPRPAAAVAHARALVARGRRPPRRRRRVDPPRRRAGGRRGGAAPRRAGDRGARRAARVPLSIDTSKAAVAEAALDAGAAFVNDVTALRGDPELAGRRRRPRAPTCCLMHMLGEPRTMQDDPRYDDVVDDVARFLEERLAFAVARRASPRSGSGSIPGSASARRSSTTSSCCAASTRSSRSAARSWSATSRKRFLGAITGAATQRPRRRHRRRERDRASSAGAERVPRPRRRRRRAGCPASWRLLPLRPVDARRRLDEPRRRSSEELDAGRRRRGRRRPETVVTVEITRPLDLHPPRRHRRRARDRPAAGDRRPLRRRRLRRDRHRPPRGHDRLRRGLPSASRSSRPSAPTARSSASARRSPTGSMERFGAEAVRGARRPSPSRRSRCRSTRSSVEVGRAREARTSR